MVAPMSGHPILPAGFNSADINGDEVDGAGVNWALEPVWVDMFIGYVPLIITEEMLDVFNGCADYVVAAEDNLTVFPHEERVLEIGADFPDYVASPANNVIVFPREERQLTVPPAGDTHKVPASSSTLEVAPETETQVMRKSG